MRYIVKGGAETVFFCKIGRSVDKLCIEDFINEFNFTFENVPDDGNCFFHTLEKYYKKNGNITSEKHHRELRSTIVSYILDNWEYYSNYGIDQEDILDLTENRSWNNNAGDIILPAAARALNLKIILYDLKQGQRSPLIKKRIIRHIYPEIEPIPIKIINILRINDNHFGLLTPNINTHKNKNKNKNKNNTNKMVKLNINKPNIQKRITRRKPKVAPNEK